MTHQRERTVLLRLTPKSWAVREHFIVPSIRSQQVARLKCDSQDLTLHTVLLDGVATLRQALFIGY